MPAPPQPRGRAAAHVSKAHSADLGQRALPSRAPSGDPRYMSADPEIIGGPTPIPVPREGDLYRWKVQNGRAEQHVYVQIAGSLKADAFEEPLRSGIESKGESVLRRLL